MNRPLFSCNDLQIGFRRYRGTWGRETIWPVKNLSLTVDSGQLVAVVGASGAGKSLLAHALLGILPPNAVVKGEMRFRGQLLTDGTVARLRGREIALVPQSVTALDPLMPVGKMVARSAELAGLSRDEARAALKAAFRRYGLSVEVEGLFPHQLSGGMARRVLLAAATVGNASLIVADEPTPGLDLPVAREVLHHLRSLADEGRGVLLITHDLELALEVLDFVVVVKDGHTVNQAHREAFQGDGSRLAHPYTRALWLALPENGMQVDA